MVELARLHERIAAVAPIHGVSIGDASDTSTWRIDFAPEATARQRADAQGILDGIDPDAPAPHFVPKLAVVDRLCAAGLFDAAMAVLDAQPRLVRERWQAASEIRSDDVEARALLKAAGADPDVILAS